MSGTLPGTVDLPRLGRQVADRGGKVLDQATNDVIDRPDARGGTGFVDHGQVTVMTLVHGGG